MSEKAQTSFDSENKESVSVEKEKDGENTKEIDVGKVLEDQEAQSEAIADVEMTDSTTEVAVEPIAANAESVDENMDVSDEAQVALSEIGEEKPTDAAGDQEVMADAETEPQKAEPEPEIALEAEPAPEMALEAKPEPEIMTGAATDKEIMAEDEIDLEKALEAEPEPEKALEAEKQPEKISEAEPEQEQEPVAEPIIKVAEPDYINEEKTQEESKIDEESSINPMIIEDNLQSVPESPKEPEPNPEIPEIQEIKETQGEMVLEISKESSDEKQKEQSQETLIIPETQNKQEETETNQESLQVKMTDNSGAMVIDDSPDVSKDGLAEESPVTEKVDKEKSPETSKSEQEPEPSTSEPEKSQQIAQIEEILKNLPMEQLMKIKGNIFDSLLTQLGKSKETEKEEPAKKETSKEPETSKDSEIQEIEDDPEVSTDPLASNVSETSKDSEQPGKPESSNKSEKPEKLDEPEKLEIPEKPKDQVKSISAAPKKPDDDVIINLDDDDDDEEPIPSEKDTKKKKTVIIKDCVNPTCPKKSDDYFKAPHFVLAYYYVGKKPQHQFICGNCFDKAIDHLEILTGELNEQTPVFKLKLPERADLVEIIDSDEEDGGDRADDDDEEDRISKEDIEFLNAEFDDILDAIVKKIDPKMQQEMAEKYLKKKITVNEEQIEELQKDLRGLERKSLEMYNRLYSINKVRIQERQPLMLIQGIDPYGTQQPEPVQRPQTASQARRQKLKEDEAKQREQAEQQKQQAAAAAAAVKYRSQTEVVQNQQMQAAAITADPSKIFYAVRTRPLNSWSPCEMVEKVVVNKSIIYKIKFLDSKTNSPSLRTVTGKHLAYSTISNRLDIGTRVIAHFNRNPGVETAGVKKFVPGVVGEKLTVYNKQRYLVFGDDGSVQYMTPENVRPVVEQSINVWEDVHINLQQFIFDYLKKQTQKQRALLNVRKGQRVATERQGRWRNAIVVDIDCSIIKLHFAEDNTYEWLYRGSKRLGPFFSQSSRPQMGFQKRNDPSIEYITIDDDAEPQLEVRPPPLIRAVAKKSTSRPPQVAQAPQPPQVQPQVPIPPPAQPPGIKVKILNDDKIYIDDPAKVAKLRHFTPRREIHAKQYELHDCGPQCIPKNTSNLSSYSPLSKPLLLYWERQIYKHKNIKEIVYKAPCGLVLRNMNEVHHFLKISKCPLNVDNFDFDITMQVLASFDVDKSLCGLYIDDITMGLEKMKIPVVNAFDDQCPPALIYSEKRIPTAGVNINTDPDFLTCCDCTDDCFDKSKCQCFQMTIAGAKYKNIMEQPEEEISYVYKRLLHTVPTGIYECNSRCKCNSRCLNKVVQQPIQVKLQAFRTKNRGWGLQALHDIPKGTFICIYAGLLYTEKQANAMCYLPGVEHGDEYFAELDYIETTQVLKDGYESDVMHMDDDHDDSDSDYKEDDYEEDKADLDYVANTNSGPREIVTRSSSRVDVSRNNSVDSTEKKSEPTPAAAPKTTTTTTQAKTANENSDSDSDGSCIEISDDDKDGGKGRKLVSTVPSVGGIIPKSDQRRFRKLFGPKERVYIMDAKTTGNIGRYFNHSCTPNLFVQSVFVDTHDPRFPWISFFALNPIKAGDELTWNYNYEVGSVPNKVLYCECGSKNCRNRIL